MLPLKPVVNNNNNHNTYNSLEDLEDDDRDADFTVDDEEYQEE